jgi:hypothetical protein
MRANECEAHMEHPPHSTLHVLFARSRKAGELAPSNWIAAFLEALYDLQRHQALGVIRAYEHFLKPNDGTESASATGEDSDDRSM